MNKWEEIKSKAKAKTVVKEGSPLVEKKPIIENRCKAFLVGFLSGGPILRTNVYREVENAGLNWEEVKEAFHKLNGREYIQRGEPFWRIMPS